MYYRVTDLIQALMQCPADYRVMFSDWHEWHAVTALGIDHELKTVDLFTEESI